MATRGIYVFTSEKYGKINIYNHWDNYPDGARGFFDAALKFEKSKDAAPNASFLDCFLKANPATEIIGCGQEIPNWGQDYVYLVNEKENGVFLEVYGTYKHFSFVGTLEEFLNSNDQEKNELNSDF